MRRENQIGMYMAARRECDRRGPYINAPSLLRRKRHEWQQNVPEHAIMSFIRRRNHVEFTVNDLKNMSVFRKQVECVNRPFSAARNTASVHCRGRVELERRRMRISANEGTRRNYKPALVQALPISCASFSRLRCADVVRFQNFRSQR